jgi:hypothetical protein
VANVIPGRASRSSCVRPNGQDDRPTASALSRVGPNRSRKARYSAIRPSGCAGRCSRSAQEPAGGVSARTATGAPAEREADGHRGLSNRAPASLQKLREGQSEIAGLAVLPGHTLWMADWGGEQAFTRATATGCALANSGPSPTERYGAPSRQPAPGRRPKDRRCPVRSSRPGISYVKCVARAGSAFKQREAHVLFCNSRLA